VRKIATLVGIQCVFAIECCKLVKGDSPDSLPFSAIFALGNFSALHSGTAFSAPIFFLSKKMFTRDFSAAFVR